MVGSLCQMATGEEELHGVLIVGGGICGLATALALHMYDPTYYAVSLRTFCLAEKVNAERV